MSAYLVNVDEDHSITSAAFPDLKVFVEVEGRPAKVYGVEENQDSSEIDCAIEGRGHARFALCYLDNRRSSKQPIETRYDLEGIWYVISTVNRLSSRIRKTIETHIRKFEFGAVPSTDDRSQAVQEPEVIDSVSTVSLSLHRCRETRPILNYTASKAPDVNAKIDENVLDERQKKAQFAFAAGVGELEKQKQTEMNWVEAIGREAEPFVKFTFTVWGRAGLEIKGYIKDEDVKPFVVPSPPPQGNNKRPRSPSEPSSREEIEAQIKRLQEQLNKAPASKGKAKSQGGDEIRRIKSEEGEAQRPRQQAEEVPVIRKGKVIYIDFDEDEAEEEERKKD
ncbi:hypothetical protein JCM5353_006637 [Sporobolomyces roseus]